MIFLSFVPPSTATHIQFFPLPFPLSAMQGRPSSSRPSTSARPTTAFDRDQFQSQQERLQQPYVIEEQYEESDDEDVFAYLPPTTADQERDPSSQSPFAFSNHVQCPGPTFDPWGRQYIIPPPIPATASLENSYSMDHTSSSPILPPGIPSPTYSQLYQPPPSSPSIYPPSTGISGPELHRLGTAASNLGVADDVERKQDGDDISNEDEGLADDEASNHHHTNKEGSDSDWVSSEEGGNIPPSGRRHSQPVTNSQDFQRVTNPHHVDTERVAGLDKETLAATIASVSKGFPEGAVSIIRERGKKNPNAQPYKVYSQQASSYYGRDVRTGSASASGVGGLPHSQFQSQYQTYRAGMGNPPATESLADSLSITHSMEDDDSPSIK